MRACRSGGFTYLTILFVVAFMGIGLALAGEVWHTGAVREKEAELLFAGNQYRKAIERYYLGGPRAYPRSLEDLLKDPRKPGTERYLRRLYPDPITGGSEWGLVKAPDGGIMGVHSTSGDKPVRTANFRGANSSFNGAGSYADWKFIFEARAQPGAAKPAPKPVPKPPPR